MISFQEALGLVRRTAEAVCASQKKTEVLSIESLGSGPSGRVLASGVLADREYPPFDRATMDGFALRAHDLENEPTRALQIQDTVLAGELYEKHILPGSCVRIMTGAPVPEGADTVLRLEDAEISGDTVAFPEISVFAGKNIARQGEDCRAGKTILPAGTLINHAALSVLAGVGANTAEVFSLPKVGIIATGDELKSVSERVLPFQIRDSNSWALRGLLSNLGITTPHVELIPDDQERLEGSIYEGLKGDVLLLTGGVSMGDADYVPQVLRAAGVEQIFHKVAMKPGKPVWFGKSKSGCLVFGLPGNPFAVQVSYKVLVEPALQILLHDTRNPHYVLSLSEDRRKRSDRAEFFPCRILPDMGLSPRRGAGLSGKPKGSGDITAGLGSDGLALHPAEKTELRAGERVAFYPWRIGREL